MEKEQLGVAESSRLWTDEEIRSNQQSCSSCGDWETEWELGAGLPCPSLRAGWDLSRYWFQSLHTQSRPLLVPT